MFNNHTLTHTSKGNERGKMYALIRPSPHSRKSHIHTNTHMHIETGARVEYARRHTTRGHSHSYSFYSRMCNEMPSRRYSFFFRSLVWLWRIRFVGFAPRNPHCDTYPKAIISLRMLPVRHRHAMHGQYFWNVLLLLYPSMHSLHSPFWFRFVTSHCNRFTFRDKTHEKKHYDFFCLSFTRSRFQIQLQFIDAPQRTPKYEFIFSFLFL